MNLPKSPPFMQAGGRRAAKNRRQKDRENGDSGSQRGRYRLQARRPNSRARPLSLCLLEGFVHDLDDLEFGLAAGICKHDQSPPAEPRKARPMGEVQLDGIEFIGADNAENLLFARLILNDDGTAEQHPAVGDISN